MSKLEKLVYLFVSIIGFFILNFILIGVIGSLLEKHDLIFLAGINKIAYLIISWQYIKIQHYNLNAISINQHFSFRNKALLKLIAGSILPVLFTLVSIIIISINDYNYSIILGNRIIIIVINSFTTGFIEELFFRGLVFYSLFKTLKHKLIAAMITSVFFSIMHLGSISEDMGYISVANIFIGSILLCYLFSLTKSIWISIGFHAINNALSSIIVYPKQTYEYTAELALIVYTVLITLLLMGIIVYDLRKRKV